MENLNVVNDLVCIYLILFVVVRCFLWHFFRKAINGAPGIGIENRGFFELNVSMTAITLCMAILTFVSLEGGRSVFALYLLFYVLYAFLLVENTSRASRVHYSVIGAALIIIPGLTSMGTDFPLFVGDSVLRSLVYFGLLSGIGEAFLLLDRKKLYKAPVKMIILMAFPGLFLAVASLVKII